MTTIEERWEAVGRSVRSDASVIQAAVRAAMLTVLQEAEEWAIVNFDEEYLGWTKLIRKRIEALK